jgi:hypothetical protein
MMRWAFSRSQSADTKGGCEPFLQTTDYKAVVPNVAYQEAFVKQNALFLWWFFYGACAFEDQLPGRVN